MWQIPAPAPSAIQPSALWSPPQGPFAAATTGTPSLLQQLLLQLLLVCPMTDRLASMTNLHLRS